MVQTEKWTAEGARRRTNSSEGCGGFQGGVEYMMDNVK